MAFYSAERLAKIRRLRKARRFWKKEPLYAFSKMKEEYPDYTYPEFLEDLKRRSKRKKKFKKSPLPRYGRFTKMQELLNQYWHTGDPDKAIAANKIRRVITKPYKMKVILEGKTNELYYDPMIPFSAIETHSKEMRNCKSWAEIDRIDAVFRDRHTTGK